jgi:hypothetical protein
MNRHVLELLNVGEAFQRGWVDARTYLEALHRATVAVAGEANELRIEAETVRLRSGSTVEVGR